MPEYRPPFFYPTANADVAVGDFNSDGVLDLLTSFFDSAFGAGRVFFLAGNRNGTFDAAVQAAAGGTTGYLLQVANLSWSSALDLATSVGLEDPSAPALSNTGTRIFSGNGNGTFPPQLDIESEGVAAAVALGDLNGGNLDLVTAAVSYRRSNDFQDPDFIVGVFLDLAESVIEPEGPEVTYPIGGRPQGMVLADFNGDGFKDVAVATDAGLSVLLNDGNGGFGGSIDLAIAGGVQGIAAGDLDGDGDIDLAVGRAQTAAVSVLLGQGSGTFAIAPDLAMFGNPREIAIADLDGNGMLDILATSDDQGASLLINDGGAEFQAATQLFGNVRTDNPIVADFNLDGAMDIAVSAPGGVSVALQEIEFHAFIAPNDFNGDGHSDILLRRTNGTTHIWEMDGTFQTGGGNTQSQTSNSWTIQETGDFNGDSNADILWRHTDGRTFLWMMDGTQSPLHQATTSRAGLNWEVQDVADFDGDGRDDILWRRDDGRTNIWLMDGGDHVGGGNTDAQTSNVWHVLAAGDFDGDGKADILWRHNDGRTHLWFMDGNDALLSGDTVSQIGLDWDFEDIGDFNGDGMADILWRQDDGTTRIWFMDGFEQIGGGDTVSQTSNIWQVQETGDYNGDGHSDILWRHDNGATFMWLMNGTDGLAHGYTYSQTSDVWMVV